MSIVVVDHKRVDMTSDEYNMYQRIVQSYTTISNNGNDLFIDLFETDAQGIIIFLKPPSKRHTSFEVFLFLMALMEQQHLRQMYKQVDDVCTQMKAKMKEIEAKQEELLSQKLEGK